MHKILKLNIAEGQEKEVGSGTEGLRGLGFGVWGFRVLGVLGFRGLGLRVN